MTLLEHVFSIYLLINMAAAAVALERAHRKQFAADRSKGRRATGRTHHLGARVISINPESQRGDAR